MKVLKLLFFVFFFAGLTALGAFIKFPLTPVPLTLQSFFALLAGAVLGAELGALSQIVYLALGLWGLPVFASGGGMGYVLQPTFGYLIGCVLATYVVGRLLEIQATTRILRSILSTIVFIMLILGSFLISNLLPGKEGLFLGQAVLGMLFILLVTLSLYFMGMDALKRLSEYTSMIDFTWALFSLLIGLGIIYLFGVTYFYFNSTLILTKSYSLGEVFEAGMLKLLPWDIIKIVTIAFLLKKINPIFKS